MHISYHRPFDHFEQVQTSEQGGTYLYARSFFVIVPRSMGLWMTAQSQTKSAHNSARMGESDKMRT